MVCGRTWFVIPDAFLSHPNEEFSRPKAVIIEPNDFNVVQEAQWLLTVSPSRQESPTTCTGDQFVEEAHLETDLESVNRDTPASVTST